MLLNNDDFLWHIKKEILIIALFLLVSGCAQEVVQEEDIALVGEQHHMIAGQLVQRTGLLWKIK